MTTGPGGVLTDPARAPKMLVDCSTVSEEASAQVRAACEKRGVADAGGAGQRQRQGGEGGHDEHRRLRPATPRSTRRSPTSDALGRGAHYVGEGELARIVKICHNVYARHRRAGDGEITVLAEKWGVPRHALLDFLNNSVMGSIFTRYKIAGAGQSRFRADLHAGLAQEGFRSGPEAGAQDRHACR